MHQIFIQIYSTLSIGPSSKESSFGFSQTPPPKTTFLYISLQNLFLSSWETILDSQILTLTCYPLGHQYTFRLIQNIAYLTSNPCSETVLTFHVPEAMQHNFVLKFHPFPRIVSTPHRSKTILTIQKNVNRTTISPIIRGCRTQGLNSTTSQTGQTCATNRQLATHESWLVRCSPHALRFSGSNLQNNIKIVL